MTIQTLQTALQALAQARPVFRSEAEFQFAFAWELQKLLPQAKIALEYPIQIQSKDCHIDIWIEEDGQSYPIELKYKTKGGTVGGVTLKNHSAVDFGCYDYLYDIHRIEQLKSSVPDFCKGWAIMLTNEPTYYKNPNSPSAYDAFKIYQDAKISGQLDWDLTSKGTVFNCGNRKGFSLAGSYTMDWNKYSSDFWYLINEV